MKNLLFLGLSLLLLSGAYGQTKTAAAGTQAADEKAIRTTINAWKTSWAKHNFKDLATYAAPGMDFVNPSGAWWKGREAVRKNHQTLHDDFFKNTAQTLKSLDIRCLKPDVALAHDLSHIGAYTTPDGKKVGNIDVVQTWVLVKHNGKWLLESGQVSEVNPNAKMPARKAVARSK
jgi:uncharacterized protein (TIGR02246 family)